jgi:hypothetical protein
VTAAAIAKEPQVVEIVRADLHRTGRQAGGTSVRVSLKITEEVSKVLHRHEYLPEHLALNF